MEEALIERIKEVLLENKLNMTQFAFKVNSEQKTVHNYLSGKRKLSLGFVESVIRTFGLDANWLLLGTENSKVENTTISSGIDYKEKWIGLLEENNELHRKLAEFYEEARILENEKGGAVASVRAAKAG